MRKRVVLITAKWSCITSNTGCDDYGLNPNVVVVIAVTNCNSKCLVDNMVF